MRRALLALAACVLATPLGAQGWSAGATAGRASFDAVAARVSSTTGGLAVRHDGARDWLYATAGTPLDGVGASWGAAGAGGFVELASRYGVTLGASVAGHTFGYTAADTASGTGGGGTVELLPTLQAVRGSLRAQLSSGFVGVADLFEGLPTERRGFLDTSAGVVWTLSPGVELSAGGRFLHGDGSDLPYAGGGAQVERAWGGAWVYGGAWLDADYPSPATAAGVGASFKLGRRTEVAGAFRQEPADPLYRSSPRRSWSVSLRRGFGPAPAAARRPGAPPPLVRGDAVVFRLPRAPGDAAPSLMGDFSGWRPVAMVGEGAFWTATVRVPRGVHHYGFRTADGRFLVPEGLPRVDDGFGGISAVLVVE